MGRVGVRVRVRVGAWLAVILAIERRAPATTQPRGGCGGGGEGAAVVGRGRRGWGGCGGGGEVAAVVVRVRRRWGGCGGGA